MRLCLAFLFAASLLSAQTRDVIGIHDLSGGSGSPTTGGLPGSCSYCHAPHNGIGGQTPLWNQKLSTATYKTYTSTTYKEAGESQLPAGNDSLLCMSCHDGTIAPGQTQAYGKVSMSGSMRPADILGSPIPTLQSSHPNSLVLPLKDDPELVKSLVAGGATADPAVKLIKGNIECDTCHNPHVEAIDKVSQNFLVIDSSKGQLCLACHDPKRVVTGSTNELWQWAISAHAIAPNTVRNVTTAPVGNYSTVGQNACVSCHQVHNAPAPAGLLRAQNELDCLLCHGGGSNISPAIPNVAKEFAKAGHPFPTNNTPHTAGEPVLLNQNRHATCVDCHNPHSSEGVAAFTPPPAIRVSQNNASGISAADGVSIVRPAAVNQFENCLRCHGASTGKTANRAIFGYLPVWTVSAGDSLNLIPQLAVTASSSHPVTHDSNSSLPQPSLRPYMLNLDGVTPGRAMGVRILCTDCHNSDDNREFGGPGPNGPHGSKFTHILERRYEASQAPRPGQPIVNPFPNPDLSAAGPYALCGKCHDLKLVLANTSFNGHAMHINAGFSCSTCHTSHGMGGFSPTISGERLVDFDANVVAPNGPTPISYNRAKNTCNLTCHGQAHGGTAFAGPASPARAGKVIVHR